MAKATLEMIDKKSVNIGVNDEKRTAVAEEMSKFLATTYSLYLKTLFYRWNVTGRQFHGLHELFEQQYEDLHAAGDEIAERIRALGHFTPGSYREFSELSQIEEDASLPKSAEQMVNNLLRDNEKCSMEARNVLKVAEDAGDEVTVDMMVARMATHDKAAWMLRATAE